MNTWPVVVCTYIYIDIRICINIPTHICYIRCSCVHSCPFVYIRKYEMDLIDVRLVASRLVSRQSTCKIFRSRWWIDATVLFIAMFSVNLSHAVNAQICHLRCVCHCDVEGIRHITSRLSHSNVELLSKYILQATHVKLTSPLLLSASRVRLLLRQTYILYICLSIYTYA